MTSSQSPLTHENHRPRTILFAGGGSGGHIAPGLAIAERLAELDPTVRCVFACSMRAVDAHMLSDAGRTFFPLAAAPLSKRPREMLHFVLATKRAISQAKALIRAEHINRVALLGGFVAAPVAWAASRIGVPTTLVNLDVPPGKANRWIGRRATDIISAIPVPPIDNHPLPGLEGPFDRHVVATPVRRCAISSRSQSDCRTALKLAPDRRTLLVTGASQGSTSINQFITAVACDHHDWLHGWQVLHLAGSDETEPIAANYRSNTIPAVVLPFLDDMSLAWGAADLAISRAGANSVAEVAANRIPTLFLPYPWHEDRHQWHNAQPLADRGAAVIIDDLIEPQRNLQSIGPTMRSLLCDNAQRAAMHSALALMQPADGAAIIAQHLLD